MRHRVKKDLSFGGVIADPGAGGTIKISESPALVELESAAAEARDLQDPVRPGMFAVVRMRTDGGDITLAADGGLNVAGNTSAVFADVGDQLLLVSVTTATDGVYRWEILVNTGSVSLS